MAHEIEAYRCVTCARESRDGVVVHVGIGHESVDEEDGFALFLRSPECWGVELNGVGYSIEEDPVSCRWGSHDEAKQDSHGRTERYVEIARMSG